MQTWSINRFTTHWVVWFLAEGLHCTSSSLCLPLLATAFLHYKSSINNTKGDNIQTPPKGPTEHMVITSAPRAMVGEEDWSPAWQYSLVPWKATHSTDTVRKQVSPTFSILFKFLWNICKERWADSLSAEPPEFFQPLPLDSRHYFPKKNGHKIPLAKVAERLDEASTRGMRHFWTRQQESMAEGQHHHHVTHAVSSHTQANSHSLAHSSRYEAILGQRH